MLYLIEKTDIFKIEKGTSVGDITVEESGWFISDYYLEEVAKARIEK